MPNELATYSMEGMGAAVLAALYLLGEGAHVY